MTVQASMNWLRNHPYFDGLIAAGIVLAVGFVVVRARLATAPVGETLDTWGGSGVLVGGTTNVPGTSAPTSQPTNQPLTQATDHGIIPLNTNDVAVGSAPDDRTFNFDDFIKSLSKPAPTPSGSSAPNTVDTSAYAYIPSGLIATTSPTASRTPTQNALYVYGNEIGETIQSFENSHPNQPAILTDFIQDRHNPDKIAAMKKLGEDYAQVGASFANIDTVPSVAQSAHNAFTASYKDLGTKLAAIPDTSSNDALYNAIITYNTSAETFVTKYLAVVNVFAAYGVTFSSQDGGSAFVFPAGGL